MKYFIILFLCSCTLNPSERWAQATGLTLTATIIQKDVVICGGQVREGCFKHSIIEINKDANDATILHELAHKLTPLHLKTGQSGVMVNQRNNMSWRPCITQDDLNLICSQVICLWQKPEC